MSCNTGLRSANPPKTSRPDANGPNDSVQAGLQECSDVARSVAVWKQPSDQDCSGPRHATAGARAGTDTSQWQCGAHHILCKHITCVSRAAYISAPVSRRQRTSVAVCLNTCALVTNMVLAQAGTRPCFHCMQTLRNTSIQRPLARGSALRRVPTHRLCPAQRRRQYAVQAQQQDDSPQSPQELSLVSQASIAGLATQYYGGQDIDTYRVSGCLCSSHSHQ